MQYKILETIETMEDLGKMAAYMEEELKNSQAAIRFLEKYDEEVGILQNFPFGYRGISLGYRGHEIRMKPFETYNIFFIVNSAEGCVTILRVLKDRQDWMRILKSKDTYRI